MAWGDLSQGRDGQPKKTTGAKGMSAEQVVRFAVVKMQERLSHRDLPDLPEDTFVPDAPRFQLRSAKAPPVTARSRKPLFVAAAAARP